MCIVAPFCLSQAFRLGGNRGDVIGKFASCVNIINAMADTAFDCGTVLSVNDVLHIHKYVVDFFAEEDPVFPGVKNENMLVSAVDRPLVGCPSNRKYPDIYSAIATLTFGLTKNHPFNDGNKRTAVIAMLAFLDMWKLQLTAEVSHDDLYRLMIDLTEDKLHTNDMVKRTLAHDTYYVSLSRKLNLPTPYKKFMSQVDSKRVARVENSDLSVFLLARWLRRWTRRKDFRDRSVTLRELRQILSKFEIRIEKEGGTQYGIYKKVPPPKKKWLSRLSSSFRSSDPPAYVKCFTLHAGGEKRSIGIDQIKKLRRSCSLQHYDYHVFYGDKTPPDYFLLEHARVLKKLALYDKGEIAGGGLRRRERGSRKFS